VNAYLAILTISAARWSYIAAFIARLPIAMVPLSLLILVEAATGRYGAGDGSVLRGGRNDPGRGRYCQLGWWKAPTPWIQPALTHFRRPKTPSPKNRVVYSTHPLHIDGYLIRHRDRHEDTCCLNSLGQAPCL
jgi:hypothetical protein